jgi:hypothetical protein
MVADQRPSARVPDDPEHIEQIRRFLRAFTFDAYGESFRCDRGV